MKIGDLVKCRPQALSPISVESMGVIVGFNKKGEGGKDFVHVLCDGHIYVLLSFTVDVIKKKD